MPAPNTPNTGPAHAARRRQGEETKAAALRKAGWLVVPPERLPRDPDTLATIIELLNRER